jgi:hypothetical protein
VTRIPKIYILAALLCCLIAVPSLAFPWCAQSDVFFWNASSDIPNYRIIDHTPERDSQRSITTPSFTSSSGEIVVGTWATPLGAPGVSSIAPGLFRFRSYAYSTSTSGSTTLKFYVINRSASGIETNLFFGNAITQDIDAVGIPQEYLTSYARRNYTTMFPGDRLVIRVNASTTSSSARAVTYDLAGNTNASMVSIGYFLCDDIDSTAGSTPGSGSGSAGLPYVFVAIGIASLALFIAAYSLKNKR